MLGILYNVPHLFTSDHQEWQCLPYGKAMETTVGLFYYWLSFVIQFALPFISLLIMNSVIIHTLRNRSIVKEQGQKHVSEGQRETQGQGQNIKILDNQVYVILPLVTFGFLILTTPAVLVLSSLHGCKLYGITKGICYLLHLWPVLQRKLQFTNHGINFFLYVISSKKFRTDLANVFRIKSNSKIQIPN